MFMLCMFCQTRTIGDIACCSHSYCLDEIAVGSIYEWTDARNRQVPIQHMESWSRLQIIHKLHELTLKIDIPCLWFSLHFQGLFWSFTSCHENIQTVLRSVITRIIQPGPATSTTYALVKIQPGWMQRRYEPSHASWVKHSYHDLPLLHLLEIERVFAKIQLPVAKQPWNQKASFVTCPCS